MRKTPAIRPPSHLSRSDKAAFRRIVGQLSASETGVSEGQVDLIADLVTARRRIATLSRMLDRETAFCDAHSVTRSQVLALNSQINSTAALAHRIAKRLGMGSKELG